MDKDGAVGGEGEAGGGGGEGGGEGGGGGDGGGPHHQHASRDSQCHLFNIATQVSDMKSKCKEENKQFCLPPPGIFAQQWQSALYGTLLGAGHTCGRSTGGLEK